MYLGSAPSLMPLALDSVRIGTDDLDAAVRAYALLLGVTPAPLAGATRRFQLGRGAVEIEPGVPGLLGIGFVGDPTADEPPSYHGLAVRIAPGAPAGDTPGGAPSATRDAVEAIDHIVVQSADPERAVALWRDRVGLRLALDREFPDRRLRLLFFRAGGITLEYATPLPRPSEPPGPDQLYGVSYRVPDLAARRAHLLAAGVDVSDVRPGMRPGTVVATVRSGTAGVPTLLIQQV